MSPNPEEKLIEIDFSPEYLFRTRAMVLPPNTKDPVYCRPFFVVLPSALDRLDAIKSSLLRAKIEVTSEHRIGEYERLATLLYDFRLDDPATYLWLMLLRFLHGQRAAAAQVLYLDRAFVRTPESYRILTDAKFEVRNQIGVDHYRVRYRGELFTPYIHHLHCPEFSECFGSYCSLQEFIPA